MIGDAPRAKSRNARGRASWSLPSVLREEIGVPSKPELVAFYRRWRLPFFLGGPPPALRVADDEGLSTFAWASGRALGFDASFRVRALRTPGLPP